jgi:hypothetical protein
MQSNRCLNNWMRYNTIRAGRSSFAERGGTRLRALLAALTAASLVACDAGVSNTLNPEPFDAQLATSALPLSAVPSFADERGGGVFIDLAGRAVRLRYDGAQGLLQSHPGNPVSAGPATAAWPLGPFSALLVTDKGLFVADSGWVIAPPWRDALPSEGLLGTALGDDGVAWISHSQGLYRLAEGKLSEFKLAGESLTGITGLTIAPAPSGAPAVWFARGEKLEYAEQTSKTAFSVKDAGLAPEAVKGGITALAGIAAGPGASGELWVITDKVLWQQRDGTWTQYDLGRAPRELKSAGRFMWLRAGDGLFRYDADAGSWAEARGLPAVPTLLAVDPAGTAWVRAGEATLGVSPGVLPRIFGLFEGVRVYDTQASIVAAVPGSPELLSMHFAFDDGEQVEVPVTSAAPGEGPQAALQLFSMGGRQSNGEPKAFSLADLLPGLHTLTVTARYANDVSVSRPLHFDYRNTVATLVGWEADMKPIFQSRCAACHVTGPGFDLSTAEKWRENSELVVSAVRDQRMPADGPLDPVLIQKIERWVSGGMLP